MEIAGITLTINKYTGRYGVSDLKNGQLSAIYHVLTAQYGLDRWGCLIDCDDDLINELFEHCEKFKDFTMDFNGGEMHYQWMDQMRGQRPGKF